MAKIVFCSMVSNGNSGSCLDIVRLRRIRGQRREGENQAHFIVASFSVFSVNFSDASICQNASFLSLVYYNFNVNLDFLGCILKSEFNFAPRSKPWLCDLPNKSHGLIHLDFEKEKEHLG